MSYRYRLFNSFLKSWFLQNKRDLPWRNSKNPYFIWISEIMSHQTQIERVAKEFFPHFIKKFPTIESLAKADWEDVFCVWDGLGYYQRGKNMIKTAKLLLEKYHGKFPKSQKELAALPGIGTYTSAAVLAFAYDETIPAIDTNISKIIKMLWPEEDLRETAEKLVKLSSGNLWNSAMMDLASFLRSGKIIEGDLGTEFFPPEIAQKFKISRKKFMNPKTEKPKNFEKIDVGVACIWEEGKYLIQTRPEGKSFEGFWEFPGGKKEKGETFRACVKREIQEELGIKVSVRPHFYEEIFEFCENGKGPKLFCLRFHRCKIQNGIPTPLENQEILWISPKKFFNNIKFLETNQNALKILQKIKV